MSVNPKRWTVVIRENPGLTRSVYGCDRYGEVRRGSFKYDLELFLGAITEDTLKGIAISCVSDRLLTELRKAEIADEEEIDSLLLELVDGREHEYSW